MSGASLSHSGRTHWFRLDPNRVSWSYNLNTKVDETYGGRVVQLLSVNLDSLTIEVDSGRGGWQYLSSVNRFCRDVMMLQKETGEPAVFSMPSRGWEMKVYLAVLPFADDVENVKYSFTLRFKIQEDVSGVISSDSMNSELNKIREGIGYERNDYNYPSDLVEDEDDLDSDGDVKEEED